MQSIYHGYHLCLYICFTVLLGLSVCVYACMYVCPPLSLSLSLSLFPPLPRSITTDCVTKRVQTHLGQTDGFKDESPSPYICLFNPV